MKFGIYRLHEPLQESDLAFIEENYKTALQLVSVYRAWNRCYIEDDLPWLERLKQLPRDMLLTWEPWRIPPDEDRPFDQPDFALENIISGMYDSYIRAFGRELATFPRKIFLRTLHEMNGNWYPWCGTVNRNSGKLFIDAWNHIRNLVNMEAPYGIEWVWSPYAHSYPATPYNTIENYFPGDDALDWVAIDGYNWGSSREWSTWRSFEEIFSDAYKTLTSITRRPFMIGEVACGESGGSKELWIREALKALKGQFSKIEILVWFDVNKECDWRIASSSASLNAFRRGAKLFSPGQDRAKPNYSLNLSAKISNIQQI